MNKHRFVFVKKKKKSSGGGKTPRKTVFGEYRCSFFKKKLAGGGKSGSL